MRSLRHGPFRVFWLLWRQRLVRFAAVGGAGIPMNTALLWFFHAALHMPLALAWACAFEPSALINFYANQRITYHDQTHVHGWDWLVRALKWQASSLSGQAVNVCVFALAVHARHALLAGQCAWYHRGLHGQFSYFQPLCLHARAHAHGAPCQPRPGV